MDNSETKIRCVVVDDELHARQSICRQIENYIYIELVAPVVLEEKESQSILLKMTKLFY